MANDITRLLATVSALGLSLGVAFDAAVAEPAATGEVAAPATQPSERTAGYDLKMAKKRTAVAAVAKPDGNVTHEDSWEKPNAKMSTHEKQHLHVKKDPK